MPDFHTLPLNPDGTIRSSVHRRVTGNPYTHLAWEEWLVDHLAPDAHALFLYGNPPTVVLGKNQNVWRETDPRLLAARDVTLARRISGGGAVYHDAGNLNVSLIGPRRSYSGDACTAMIQAALADFGIVAEADARQVLTVAGRKVSGAAFCYRRQVVMHHCTLLVHTDLDALEACLRPALPSLRTHAVDSVRARVANLSEFVPELQSQPLADALERHFRERFARDAWQPTNGYPLLAWEAFQARIDHHAGDAWVYDHSPTFRAPTSVDGVAVELVVRKGRVETVEAVDEADQSLAAGLDKRWRGTRFLEPEVRRLVGLA